MTGKSTRVVAGAVVFALLIAALMWAAHSTPAEREAEALAGVSDFCDRALSEWRDDVAAVGGWQLESVVGTRARLRALVRARDAGPKDRTGGTMECRYGDGRATVKAIP